MRYFRLIENLPGRDPLGFGMGPGRWNVNGTPIIYACSVSALNFLELLSIKGPIVTESSWKMVSLEVVGHIPELEVDELPISWKNRPYPRTTQELGSIWAKRELSPYLKVPSCRIPLANFSQEHNLLINPMHPEFKQKIKVTDTWDVSFEVNR